MVPGNITEFRASVVAAENVPGNPPTPGEGVATNPLGRWAAGTQMLCAGTDCERLSTRVAFAEGTGGWVIREEQRDG